MIEAISTVIENSSMKLKDITLIPSVVIFLRSIRTHNAAGHWAVNEYRGYIFHLKPA